MVLAMDYSSEAFGNVVFSLRKHLGVTQEELGRRAGYQTGAGVAISRIESGRSRPGLQRFEGLAAALGLSPGELSDLAAAEQERSDFSSRESASTAGPRPRGRHQRLQQEVGRRSAIGERLEEQLEQATERSIDLFLVPFIEAASSIAGAPDDLPPELSPRSDRGRSSATGAEAELLQVSDRVVAALGALAQATAARNGVLDLANESVGSAVGSLNEALGRTAKGLALGAGSRFGKAGTGRPIRELNGAAAENALYALFGGGPKATGGAGKAGGQLRVQRLEQHSGIVIAVGMLGLATLAGLAVGSRWRKENDEVLEAALLESLASFEALEKLVPKAVRVLDDIAVHGGRAVGKWHDQLGTEPWHWDHLSAEQRTRYSEFAEIVACQKVVTWLELGSLMELRGEELDLEVARATDVLDLLQQRVDSLV
jgi:transcriptional regulator with XRE-family HTH domain